MKLNYKASNIAKAEREYGMKFFKAFNSMNEMGVAELQFLYRAGGASDEEFDEMFAKGIEEAFVPILEGINDAGFLAEKIDIQNFKEALKSPAPKK